MAKAVPLEIVIIVMLLLWSCTASALDSGKDYQTKIIRTLVYHEIPSVTSNEKGEFTWHNGVSPVLSDNGEYAAYGVANYTDPRSNHIFVVNTNGKSPPREFDSFQDGGAGDIQTEISPDGSKVVADRGNWELRMSDEHGLKGKFDFDGGIRDFRILNNGQVYFVVANDGSVRGSSPVIPVKRGLWRINFDGSGLTQIIGADQVAKLLSVSSDSVGFYGPTPSFRGLDISPSTSRIVFSAYSSKGLGIFGVNSDESGLREYAFSKDYILGENSVGISGDGLKVFYNINPNPWGTPKEVGMFNFDGSGRRILINGSTTYYVEGYGKLDFDGSLLFLGGDRELLVDTENDSKMILTTLCGWDSNEGALAGDGMFMSSMDSKGDKFLYLFQLGDRRHLAVLEINPTDLGEAPHIDNPKLEPPYILTKGDLQSNVSALVTSNNTIVAVGTDFLLNGFRDDSSSVGRVSLKSAGNGIFSGVIKGNQNIPVGPRIVRIKAEVKETDGMRHATAVDLWPFAVADSKDQAIGMLNTTPPTLPTTVNPPTSSNPPILGAPPDKPPTITGPPPTTTTSTPGNGNQNINLIGVQPSPFSNLSFMGNPVLIQSRFGSKGNFELVVPLATGGLAHFWRDNDAAGMPWKGPTIFGGPDKYDALTMIQSNYGSPGNLEVIARTNDRLVFFWRDSGPSFIWSGPYPLDKSLPQNTTETTTSSGSTAVTAGTSTAISPWNDPSVHSFIDEWILQSTNCLKKVEPGLYINSWGQTVGESKTAWIRAVAPPDHPPDWDSYHFVWYTNYCPDYYKYNVQDYVKLRQSGRSFDSLAGCKGKNDPCDSG